MRRRSVLKAITDDQSELSQFERKRPSDVSTERLVDVRLETSAAAGDRLLEAIRRGAQDFVMTTRDGTMSAIVRIRITSAGASQHQIGGRTVTVEWDECTVEHCRARVSLSRTELRLLAVLLESPDKPVPRAELIARVWPGRSEEGVARENALAVYVCTLRKRLATIGVGNAVRTLRGRGYQLA